jgi:hypothetical protein
MLDVPVHKTGTAFSKPIEAVVGDAVLAWERVRPVQPLAVDNKTGEQVEFLLSYRAKIIPHNYLNRHLIPMLCRKAGIPAADARGRISSHRARSTIASQLFNAREPMTLFELQAWLGHRSPVTTQHYVAFTPTKLAKAYSEAQYFQRNLRMMEVLIDRLAIDERSTDQRGATTTWATDCVRMNSMSNVRTAWPVHGATSTFRRNRLVQSCLHRRPG